MEDDNNNIDSIENSVQKQFHKIEYKKIIYILIVIIILINIIFFPSDIAIPKNFTEDKDIKNDNPSNNDNIQMGLTNKQKMEYIRENTRNHFKNFEFVSLLGFIIILYYLLWNNSEQIQDDNSKDKQENINDKTKYFLLKNYESDYEI